MLRGRQKKLSDTKAVKDKPAAAIESARAKKYQMQTYNPLLYVIKKQVLDGRRRKEPKLTPAAVTTFGELGPGYTVVQECHGVACHAAQRASHVPQREARRRQCVAGGRAF